LAGKKDIVQPSQAFDLTRLSGEYITMKKHLVTLVCLLLFAGRLPAQDVPKAEGYVGYSFLRFNDSSPTNAFSANGGLASFQYNFNQHIGLVGEFGGAHNGNLGISGTRVFSPNQTSFTYLFGPRFFINKGGVVSPFFEAFGGGIHNSRSFFVPNSVPPGPIAPIRGVNVTPGLTATKFNSTENVAAVAVGGGIDIRLSHRFGIRPIELDYLPTNLTPFNIPGVGRVNNSNWQHNFRYSGGINFRFGGAPPVPPRASCSATPAELLPWEGPVNVSVEPADFNPKHNLDVNWATSGGSLTEQGKSAKVDTAGLAPGNYTITSHVKDPRTRRENTATCTASFTVKQPQPPAVACSVSPSSVHPGEPVAVTVEGSSPNGSRIEKRSFSASAGSVKEGETTTGNQPGQFTTAATLDTSNVAPGPVNIDVGVTDVHGFSGRCTTTATVVAPPPPAPPPPAQVVSETLVSECDFKSQTKLARVDNECKATLDDVALKLQQEPNGKLVIVGYADDQEGALVNDLESLRAANAKHYLTAGEAKQQIDPARIEARKSNDRNSGNAVKFYFVPEGGTFTVKDTTVVDENSLPRDRTGAPHKRISGSSEAKPNQ